MSSAPKDKPTQQKGSTIRPGSAAENTTPEATKSGVQKTPEADQTSGHSAHVPKERGDDYSVGSDQNFNRESEDGDDGYSGAGNDYYSYQDGGNQDATGGCRQGSGGWDDSCSGGSDSSCSGAYYGSDACDGESRI